MSAQEFAGQVNSGNAPWLVTTGGEKNDWTDSTKEQYFNFLNAEQANELELERWRLNNEYNTPKAQMERMVAAGINPAAAYQQVSSGNSSSVPGVHEAQTARFHDTTDKLAKVNTIMQSIASIASTIKTGVDTVAGIQDIGITHQNNWYDQMRAQYFRNGGVQFAYLSPRKSDFTNPYQVAPGLYTDAVAAQLLPEMYQSLNSNAYRWADQHALMERQTRIDDLVQNIFKSIENGASISDMTNMFLQLMVYSLIKF